MKNLKLSVLIIIIFLMAGCATTPKCQMDSTCKQKFRIRIENTEKAILIKVKDKVISTIGKKPRADYKLPEDLQKIMPYIWDSAEFDLTISYPCEDKK